MSPNVFFSSAGGYESKAVCFSVCAYVFTRVTQIIRVNINTIVYTCFTRFHRAPACQISRQSGNVRLSYWWLSIFFRRFLEGPKYRYVLAQTCHQIVFSLADWLIVYSWKLSPWVVNCTRYCCAHTRVLYSSSFRHIGSNRREKIK